MKGKMNSMWRVATALVLVLSFSLVMAVPALATGPAAVNLGTASNFAILAKTGISTTGTTSIVGDIGVSPAAATYITGFGLILDASGQFSTSDPSSLVTGKVYAADYTEPTPTNLGIAVLDMETAYTDAAGRTDPDETELGEGDISGLTLAPGLYKWGTGVLINYTGVDNTGVTLSGGADDVWIFQIAGTLTVGNGAIVNLSGDAQAKNIFWQVADVVSLGTTSVFNGNILAQTMIAMNTGATLNGRALAQSAVTLDANTITLPVAAEEEPEVVSPQLVQHGTGSAEWSTAEAHSGSYSVKLFAPATTGDYGIVVMPLDMEFENLADFSVWVEGGAVAAQALPLLDIKLEIDAVDVILTASNKGTGDGVNIGGATTVMLASQPGQCEVDIETPTLMSDGDAGWEKYGTHTDATINVGGGENAYWSMFVYDGPAAGTYDYYTWDEIHGFFNSKATVTMVRVELRYPQDPADVDSTVYVDDIEINDTTYELEPRVINTDTLEGFNIIQDAIDAATAGDTIIANDGTYTEDLTVDIADLTLKSETGKANTTIQLVDGVGIDIQAGASGFTLGGAEDEGFTVKVASSTTFNIQVVNAPSDVEISYNEIDSTGNEDKIVLNVGAAGASGLTVSNNTFTAEAGDGCVWGPNVVDVTIDSNMIDGGAYGVQFSGVTGTSTISNNTISGCTGSGAIVISNGAGTSGLTINLNTIDECSNGIYFAEYCAQGTAADMTTVTVTYNTITNNTTGLKISASTYILASNFAINYNSFVGNFAPTTGLANSNAEEVDAENNWWGSASGPSGEGPGLGDAVSVNVDFTPWLLSEGGEPVVTYTDYISVPDGWSLISPDKAWADWDALGSDLVLTYDTSLLVPAFVEPQSSSLSPLSAIYIKTTGGGLLGMNYPDYDLGMYATNLEVGWNLIGIPETGALPGAILSPLCYGANNETALATLANQSNYNLSEVPSFYVDAFDWANIEGLTLDAFDGYWAYMNVAKEFGVIVVPPEEPS